MKESASVEAVAAAFDVLERMPQSMSLVCTQTGRVLRANAQGRERWSVGAKIDVQEFGASTWEAASESAPTRRRVVEREGGGLPLAGVHALPFCIDNQPPLVLCMTSTETLTPVIAGSLVDRLALMTRLYSLCPEDVVAAGAARAAEKTAGGVAVVEDARPGIARLKELLSWPVPLAATEHAVDMVVVANEMCRALEPVLAGVELTVHCDTASLVIGADLGMSRQLILALVLNAFTRTRTGGGRRMALQLDAVEPYVDLGVWDEGLPLTDQEFAAILEEDLSAPGSSPRTALDHARSLALGMGGDISLGSHEQRPSMNEVRVSFPALRASGSRG